MESIIRPITNNSVNIEPSNTNENWPRFNNISEGIFTVNSPFVPCILTGVNVSPTGLLKLFCYHPNSTWEHVTNVPSRPLTNITSGP